MTENRIPNRYIVGYGYAEYDAELLAVRMGSTKGELLAEIFDRICNYPGDRSRYRALRKVELASILADFDTAERDNAANAERLNAERIEAARLARVAALIVERDRERARMRRIHERAALVARSIERREAARAEFYADRKGVIG